MPTMPTMRALVLHGPGRASVEDVPAPAAGPGQVVVEVHRVGVCGTDTEFYNGGMAYLATGQARYPLRPGHEWCGVVAELGDGVDTGWLGRRVTGGSTSASTASRSACSAAGTARWPSG
jgi:threonine dehydrogenase-like Zn-dependent dehydrogenase